MSAMDSRYFAVQRRALEIVGFDPSTPQLKLKHPIWAGILVLSLVSHNWPMAVYALQDLSDLTRLTDNFAVVMQGSLSTFKFLAFVVNRRRIGSLVHRLHQLNEEGSRSSSQGRERILEENQLDRYVSKAFRNAAYGVIVASAIAPMLIGLLGYIRFGIFTPTTPMEFNFWLDETRAIFYWPIYVWGVLGVAAAAWLAISTDTLFSWLIHNVVAQFQLLELELLERKEQQEEVHLVKCINRHRLALELAEELSSIFAEIVFVKYMLSYLQLCMLAFRFSRSGWSSQVPFRATFLVAVFIQLSSYCYGGEYLKQQSLGISEAVYAHSNWPEMTPQRRRLWRMIIMRAQRPAKIFGYMFNVDLPLLLWVTRTAGSFLALLRTFAS